MSNTKNVDADLALPSAVVEGRDESVRALDIQNGFCTASHITRETLAQFLIERGWVNERPDFIFAWKDPRSRERGYTLMSAVENQLEYERQSQSATKTL
jgi:hypothetical protein